MYSVLRVLISFKEAPWYSLVYYVWSITSTWRSKCATSIWFTISKVTVGINICFLLVIVKKCLMRIISCYFTFIYNYYVVLLCFIINYHKPLLLLQISNLLFMQYCVTKVFSAFNYIYDLSKASTSNIKQTLKDRTLSGVSRWLWGWSWLWFKFSGFNNLRQYTTVTNQC